MKIFVAKRHSFQRGAPADTSLSDEVIRHEIFSITQCERKKKIYLYFLSAASCKSINRPSRLRASLDRWVAVAEFRRCRKGLNKQKFVPIAQTIRFPFRIAIANAEEEEKKRVSGPMIYHFNST